MEGPYLYRGTLRGRPLTGFAFYERALALYRDWELVDVLAAAVANLRPRPARLEAMVAGLRTSIAEGRRQEALDCLDRAVRPVIDPTATGTGVAGIVADLANLLR